LCLGAETDIKEVHAPGVRHTDSHRRYDPVRCRSHPASRQTSRLLTTEEVARLLRVDPSSAALAS
jgi:hypothetical protein